MSTKMESRKVASLSLFVILLLPVSFIVFCIVLGVQFIAETVGIEL